MFDLMIMVSRYLFVLYIALFLWNGFIYILDEKGTRFGSPNHAVSIQRIVIIFTHITAFLILAYKPGELKFDLNSLGVGIAGLVIIIYANFTTSKIYRGSCPLIWNGMFFLMDVGMIFLQRLNPSLAMKQLVWIFFGLNIMLLIPIVLKLIPRFESLEKLYIIMSFVLIIMTFVLGKEQYGSVNWIKIGPFGLQPSEIVKFLFIFYLASVFRKKVELKELIITGFLSASIVLLLVIQRDLGGALIFFMTYMVMLYVSTSNEIIFFSGMGAAALASMIAYQLFSHVRVRVSAWKNPWVDIDKGGYQIVQSLFAITTWGLFGCGLTKGLPTKIPVVEKDFIFAAICEEFGSLFGIGIVCIFIMIFTRGIIIALNCKRRYYSLLAFGVTTMFAFQAFLIIGGVIKFIPLTGVTLPFVSYGGSSVLVSIMMIGLLQWINVYYERHSHMGGENHE